MIPCPSCHKPVEILDKHVGTLFTCPHCNAVYFIDFSGQPEMANHEAEVETPSAYEPPAQDFSSPQDYSSEASVPADLSAETNYAHEQPVEQNYVQENNFQPDEDAAYSNEQNESSEQNYSSEQNFGSQDQSFENSSESAEQNDFSTPQDSAYSEAEPTPVVEEAPFDFNRTLDQAPAEAPPPVSVSDNSDFSDVTDFANADTVAGPLTYVVMIDGIESSQLLYQLKEAMTDSRFGWDVAELLSTVGGGRMVIPGLTPAKASVLINRIKYLPFKISWRQDVLSSS